MKTFNFHDIDDESTPQWPIWLSYIASEETLKNMGKTFRGNTAKTKLIKAVCIHCMYLYL